MPQATNSLFSAADLTAWLRQPVEEEAAAMTEKVVWGWIRPLLGVQERPENPSDELLSWAIELGGIAYVNPEGLGSYALESEKSVYSGERRGEVLALVRSGGQSPTGTASGPVGDFPCAAPEPSWLPHEGCW